MVFLMATLLALLLAAVACSAAPAVLWSHNITGDAYWAGALAGGTLYAGTFGGRVCRTDVLDAATGAARAPYMGVCQAGAWTNAFGGVGFSYPKLNIAYNASGATWRQSIPGGFYFAMGNSPVVLREGRMFVWGSNFDQASNAPQFACMYVIAADTGTMTKGPCLKDFGDGETAEVNFSIFTCVSICICLIYV
jgi:hypothetical protein